MWTPRLNRFFFTKAAKSKHPITCEHVLAFLEHDLHVHCNMTPRGRFAEIVLVEFGGLGRRLHQPDSAVSNDSSYNWCRTRLRSSGDSLLWHFRPTSLQTAA